MKISTEPYKGVRDFYPEDMAVQNYIFNVWRKTAEEVGYVEYGASILEPAELYRAKSGDEIVNDQMFLFTDRGGREVALRPEMTPTLARMVAAQRKSLKFPLRWFSMPNLFRYEKPQRGRRREHWQLNCDLVGVAGIEGDIEIISLAYQIMKNFGAHDSDFEIKINSRGAIFSALKNAGIPDEKLNSYLSLLDKKEKISPEEFAAQEKELIGENISVSMEDGSINELLNKAREKGITNITHDNSIIRGFSYYTGMVFEVFDTNPENKRSIFGGGRYDNLLEIFGVEPVPTVGFGMGDITIRDFLETHNLPTAKK